MSILSVAKNVKSKLPFFNGKKWSKKKIIITAVAAVLIVALAIFLISKTTGTPVITGQAAVVGRGDISKVIEGSGTIRAVDQYEVTALVKGEILADYFAEGQEVKEGDLLYSIDTSDIENSIEKSEASLEKSRLSYEQSRETVTNLTVRSPISGTIKELYIKNGDNAGNNTKVAEVINSDYMRLKINFNYADAQNMRKGQSAQIYMSSSAPLTGEVESVATGYVLSNSGAPVTPVEIVVANPGAIRPGDTATAIVGDYACNDSGTFEYYQTATVMAKSSGEVYNVRVRTGDKINAGGVIASLDSTSAHVSARQSELSLKDSQLALDNLMEQKEDYNIKSPISGKVIQKNSKAGDKLDNSNSNTTMAIIADLSSLVFEISVDELDISNIKVGQTVTITADALTGRRFTGHVETISIVGTSSNGVTSYPVKVVIDDSVDSGLIPGMNVNASIVIDSRQDVLRIPIAAVNRGNIVYVKSDSESAKNPTGAMNSASAQMPTSPTGENKGEIPTSPTGENKGETPTRPTGENKGEIPTSPTGENKGEIPTRPTGENKDEIPTRPAGNNNGTPKSGAGTTTAPMGGMNAWTTKMLEEAQKNAPKGYTAVIVRLGLSDGNYAEIIGGLAEGDEIFIPITQSTAAGSQGNRTGMGSGMPMGSGMSMGGGMPMSGGMRTGGMSAGSARYTGGMTSGRR